MQVFVYIGFINSIDSSYVMPYIKYRIQNGAKERMIRIAWNRMSKSRITHSMNVNWIISYLSQQLRCCILKPTEDINAAARPSAINSSSSWVRRVPIHNYIRRIYIYVVQHFKYALFSLSSYLSCSSSLNFLNLVNSCFIFCCLCFHGRPLLASWWMDCLITIWVW